MFVISIIKDLIRVPPISFQLSRPEAIQDQIHKKYSYRVFHNVGLCIKLFDIQSISDGVVHACQDGSYQCHVTFRMIVFRPSKGQVLLGMIKECDPQKGIRISLQFFDDIYIPPAYLMENTIFNREEGVWVWNYGGQELFMDPGNWIRFRIEQSQFVDVGPIKTEKLETQPARQAPLTLYASCAESGLGLFVFKNSNGAVFPEKVSGSSIKSQVVSYRFIPTSRAQQKAVCVSVGFTCKLFLKLFTRFHVENHHYLQEAIHSNQPLITVSNHDATIDDPLIFGLLDSKTLASERCRYSLGAQEICFKNTLLSYFFSAGRVIPIIRGNGIYQQGMDHAIQILDQNGWIHLFPEGKVNIDYRNMCKFRWGVGRLVMETKQSPLILPFYHRGMADIRPEKYKWGVKFGKRLDVVFGKPFTIDQTNFSHLSETRQRIEITSMIEKSVKGLKEHLENKKEY